MGADIMFTLFLFAFAMVPGIATSDDGYIRTPNKSPPSSTRSMERQMDFYSTVDDKRTIYDCSDRHELCKKWAEDGECCNNPIFMDEYCRTSCEICVTGDRHLQCGYWARRGECKKNPKYMNSHCLKSCDKYSMHSSDTTHTDDILEKLIDNIVSVK